MFTEANKGGLVKYSQVGFYLEVDDWWGDMDEKISESYRFKSQEECLAAKNLIEKIKKENIYIEIKKQLEKSTLSKDEKELFIGFVPYNWDCDMYLDVRSMTHDFFFYENGQKFNVDFS